MAVQDNRKILYDLLLAKLKEKEESLFKDKSFNKTFKFFIGGYTLYKYYPSSILESPLLKTEDVDFKIILNSSTLISDE